MELSTIVHSVWVNLNQTKLRLIQRTKKIAFFDFFSREKTLDFVHLHPVLNIYIRFYTVLTIFWPFGGIFEEFWGLFEVKKSRIISFDVFLQRNKPKSKIVFARVQNRSTDQGRRNSRSLSADRSQQKTFQDRRKLQSDHIKQTRYTPNQGSEGRNGSSGRGRTKMAVPRGPGSKSDSSWLQRCWWQRHLDDFMRVTVLSCWWQKHNIGDFLNLINLSPISIKVVINTVCLQHPSPTSM